MRDDEVSLASIESLTGLFDTFYHDGTKFQAGQFRTVLHFHDVAIPEASRTNERARILLTQHEKKSSDH